VIKERVGRWTWQERTCRDLASLRALAGTSDLSRWVLRLVLEMSVTLPELHEVEVLLDQLGGTAARHNRAGVMILDRSRLTLAPSALAEDFGEQQLPAVLSTVAERLSAIRDSNSDQERLAERALWHLYRLLREEL
jgi:hypothetical protein